MAKRSKQTNINATLEEVASHSGVSIATVSRVINTSGPVSKEVEDRVKQAIDELGFVPKRKKSQLRVKPKILALIVPEVSNPANAAIITGAYEEAERLHTKIFVLPIQEKQRVEYKSSNLGILKDINCDGIILLHNQLQPEAILEAYFKNPVPIILLNKSAEQANHHCIDTDRESAMYKVAKYLLSLNHRRIVYIGKKTNYEAQARLRGLLKGFSESGIEFGDDAYYDCSSTMEDGFKVCNNLLLLEKTKRPTAIITYNDLIAIGALHAIRSKGFSVPEDISVVGFDDIYLAAHTNPPLTTVSQPKYQMGQLGVRTALDVLNGLNTSPGGLTLLECPLIIRESTAPCQNL